MRYGSVCSGIEAATMAWEPLGWTPSFFSEIDNFPRAVLQHHYPETPLHGDFTTIEADTYEPIRLLVGGTPCQSFSVAGLRKGLDDDRGNLALEYLRLAQRLRPEWLVWENVPGVLSSSGGRDFGAFLGGLVELGYGFAYRVLDAQYFGVPQRRRRVFVVGCLGGWERAAAVLFDRESLRGNPPPSREAREGVTGGAADGVSTSHDPACTLTAREYKGALLEANLSTVVCFHQNSRDEVRTSEVAGALSSGGGKPGQGYPAVAFTASAQANSYAWESDVNPTLNAQVPNDTSNIQYGIRQGAQVRRLTPRECERLQGFPDDFTQIPYRNKPADKCPDGPRYKALGNSMAVPVMRWIGERIQMVDDMSMDLAEDEMVEIVTGIN